MEKEAEKLFSVHSAHNHDHIISLNSKSLKWIKGEITNSLNADTHALARTHRIAQLSSAQLSADHIIQWHVCDFVHTRGNTINTIRYIYSNVLLFQLPI